MSVVRALGARAIASDQLPRFAASGALVATVYFTLMTVFSIVAGLPDQVALAVAYISALVLHFTLNRRFVFASRHGYALHISTQGVRYLVFAGVSYTITALALAFLPDALGVPALAVYFPVAGCLAVVNFLVLRAWVFRSGGHVGT